MRLAIINGPNLNQIGSREPKWYGTHSFDDFYLQLQDDFSAQGVSFTYFQSNSEGALIDQIYQLKEEGIDGIVLNAGAYTHTSIALRDCIKASELPFVEVHLSNVYAREEFRHKSMLAGVCLGSISGFGLQSYRLAVEAFLSYKKHKK